MPAKSVSSFLQRAFTEARQFGQYLCQERGAVSGIAVLSSLHLSGGGAMLGFGIYHNASSLWGIGGPMIVLGLVGSFATLRCYRDYRAQQNGFSPD